MQKFLVRILFLVLLISAAESLANETVATCGEMTGYAYHHKFGIVPKIHTGFQEDSIGINRIVS